MASVILTWDKGRGLGLSDYAHAQLNNNIFEYSRVPCVGERLFALGEFFAVVGVGHYPPGPNQSDALVSIERI